MGMSNKPTLYPQTAAKPALHAFRSSLAPYSIVAAIALPLAVVFAGYAFDDPFITYRYAENILAGRGFGYNPGTRVLSTTTPLYALLLVLPGAAGVPIPLASNLIGCVSIAAGALALLRLGRLWGTPVAGWLMLVLYPLNSLLLSSLGGEGSLYVASIVWAFVACTTRRYLVAALLLAVATLTRADGLLAAGAAALFVLSRQLPGEHDAGLAWRRRGIAALRGLPWPALALFAAVLAVWAVFAIWYFGSPIPATLAAKQQQGQMAASRSFLRGLYGQALSLTDQPLLKAQLVFVLVGVVAALRRFRGWLLLLGWSVLYTASYAVLGVSGYFWYYVPLVPGFVALVALGIDQASRAVASLGRPAPKLAVGLSLLIAGALALTYAAKLPAVRSNGEARTAIYQRAGAWLRDHTPAGASVGTLEVGIIGYYAERAMVDFAGLLQPDVARVLGPRTTYDDAALFAVERYRPDYLVLQRGVLPALEANIAEHEACSLETTFSEDQYPHLLDVYACRWRGATHD